MFLLYKKQLSHRV